VHVNTVGPLMESSHTPSSALNCGIHLHREIDDSGPAGVVAAVWLMLPPKDLIEVL